mgnify:CR=1 FL=1
MSNNITKRIPITELNRIIAESVESQFNPKLGKDVDKDDKSNNSKAVKDILTNTAKYNSQKYEKPNTDGVNSKDYNNTTLEYRFQDDPPQSYKDRVKKLAVNGSLANDTDESSDTEGNKKFVEKRGEISDERETERKKEMDAGLVGRERKNDKNYNHKAYTIFAENVNKDVTKRLYFKNTIFLNESEMLKRIPDDYKQKEGKFYMKDAAGSEYLVECKIDPTFKIPQLKVLNSLNDNVINEQINRMQELSGYNRSEFKNTIDKSTLNVDELHESIETIRNLRK